jgi:IS30 family transposase
MVKYSRVSYEVRCQIFALLQANFSVKDIATKVEAHKSTIYREIKRNATHNKYLPSCAHRKYLRRKTRCQKKIVSLGNYKELILSKIFLYWSPEQIAGRLKREGKKCVSIETIYKYIRKNPELKKYMRFMSKGGPSRYKQRTDAKLTRLSIHKRPDVINKRLRIGDWERDGMYGANRRQLLICTERKSKYTKIGLIKETRSSQINDLTLKLIKETNKKILSITNDNGSEFRRSLNEDIPVYFCDPMKPQQRGTVENTIGILRKQIKRSTDLFGLSDENIKDLEKQFNLVPRKGLDYKTPYEVFFEQKVALAN